jgi:RNA polymerase sigma-70 factor (ECF subfamily)
VPDDSILVATIRAGDPAGLGALYDRYASAMLRVAWRLCASMSDAEDVVHDVFVRLPELLQRYEHRTSLKGWLLTVTARAALMHLRRTTRRREDSLDSARHHLAPDASHASADQHDIERQVAQLPGTLRAVVVLRLIEGFTHDEIAALLGITVGASRVRLSRALDLLRTTMVPEFRPLHDASATPATTRT